MFSAVIILVALLTSVGTNTINQQTKVDAVVGSDAVLPCQSSLPKPVEWQSPGPAFDEIAFGGEVHQRHRDRFSLVEAPTGGDRNSLLIRSTRLNDSGEYTCVEDNGIGTSHLVVLFVRDASDERKNVGDLLSTVIKTSSTSMPTVDAPVSNDGTTQESILLLIITFVSLIFALILVVVVIVLLIYVHRLRSEVARTNRSGGSSNGLLNNANNGSLLA